MSGKRQHNQNQLAFGSSGQVKLVSSDRKGPERLWWREKPKARMESFASVGSKSQLIRTAVYGTVRTVVWEGRMSDCPPYPDQDWLPHEQAEGLLTANCQSPGAASHKKRWSTLR